MPQSVYEFTKDYLDLALKKSARRGMTKWAMVGASAALAWFILGKINPKNVLEVAQAVSYLTPCFLIASLIFELSGQSPRDARYRVLKIGPVASLNRQHALATFVACGALFLAYLYFFWAAPRVPLFLGGLLTFTYSVAGAAVFVKNLKSEFTIEQKNISERGAIVALVVLVLLGIFGLYFVFRELPEEFAQIGRTEWQLAGSAIAIGWLLVQLLSEGKDEVRLKAIEDIWIEHSIGEIDDDEAKLRIRHLVHGARIDEVFEAYVVRFQKALRRAEDRIESIEAVQKATAPDATVVSAEIAVLLGSSVAGLTSDLESSLDDCNRILLEMKAEIARYPEAPFRKDALEIHDQLAAKLHPLREKLARTKLA